MTDPQDIKTAVKSFILDEFLQGENPDELTDTTPLVSGGILDSLATLRLVTFVDETFGIQLEAHELTAEHLETLDKISALIASKL